MDEDKPLATERVEAQGFYYSSEWLSSYRLYPMRLLFSIYRFTNRTVRIPSLKLKRAK